MRLLWSETKRENFSSFPFRFLMRYVGRVLGVGFTFLEWFYLCTFSLRFCPNILSRDKKGRDSLPILPASICNIADSLGFYGAVKKSHFQKYSFVFSLLHSPTLVSLWKFNKNSFSFCALWSELRDACEIKRKSFMNF